MKKVLLLMPVLALTLVHFVCGLGQALRLGLSRVLLRTPLVGPARLLGFVVDHPGQGLRRAGPDDVVRRLFLSRC